MISLEVHCIFKWLDLSNSFIESDEEGMISVAEYQAIFTQIVCPRLCTVLFYPDIISCISCLLLWMLLVNS